MKELSPVPPDALAVDARDLRKEFVRKDRKRGKRRVAALDDVSLEIARGECVAILGQNGSGKSTLVRLLSTLLLPDGGSASVFGYDVVRDGKAVRRLVNRVSVEASFFKKMSPSENLHYAARFYGMTPSETTEQIPLILERVGFPAERRTEPMENLSRGMQQKVALARALLTSPVLLLLDEPTTGLDPRSKLEVQDFIREMRAVHDSTILLCTHDLERGRVARRAGRDPRSRPAARARARRGAPGALRRGDARGRVLRGDRARLRGRGGRGGRGGTKGARMRAVALSLRHELIGLAGVVERNVYLTRRYIYWDVAFFVWTVANTLTIVFIAEGIEASGGRIDVDRATATLLIGAVVWAYLGIIFEFLTETVAWERWEGTIEYTFMAPLSRAMHLGGSGVFAVLYGLVRAILLFAVVAAFFGLQFEDANFLAALVILVVASISFFGIGMMTAVLPLISPEKGAQLGFVAQGMLLVVSGVYYPVDVLPEWMQWLSTISPATYALDGIRASILDGASLGSLWHDIWPLLVIGAASIPLGLAIFNRGEVYAKRHGKLKRSG